MQHLTFKIAFLTPAFIGGAYPKREGAHGPAAELRAPSILGQLRWWHRFLGKQDSEARIFGAVAGESGTSAGFSLRILHPPERVETATTPSSLNLSPSYFLYAQEMDKGANHRAALPRDESFDLVLINRRLSPADWKNLLATATAFTWLGALGNRSRRGFGALTLLEINGKIPEMPNPADLLPPHGACSFAQGFEPQQNFEKFATAAGNWLRDARRTLKDSGRRKSDYFGSISEKGNTRLASPIQLRPWMLGKKWHLLLVGPTRLLRDVSQPEASSTQPDTSSDPIGPFDFDPVADLLAAPFAFASIALYQRQVRQWQSDGRTDLVQRFVELTQEPKYGGLRSQPWYPK